MQFEDRRRKDWGLTPSDWIALRGPRSLEDLEIMGRDKRFAHMVHCPVLNFTNSGYGPATPITPVLTAAKAITDQMEKDGEF